ncbi:hypothetical protein ARMGADRAFT_574338 [Armillaria gallica]|uniref:Uncharacterized protein n=1 Tax=Armillaria gallica TaxID=47427 RepID=A0A2H3DT01_ARMGA|nr:hypothetical protein ARMGADRAFT_574338 [Armillaria gallica]
MKIRTQMEALCSSSFKLQASNFMARRFLNCALTAPQGLKEVEQGILLAERRETRMAVESECRTWLSWESIPSLTTLANFWAQRVLQEPVFTPLLLSPQDSFNGLDYKFRV